MKGVYDLTYFLEKQFFTFYSVFSITYTVTPTDTDFRNTEFCTES
uniref:Uncharacterized protein n=1 Tax=Anguilla anguilla TaxID=7936 RepID=A0A0E9TVU4_ANGAN